MLTFDWFSLKFTLTTWWVDLFGTVLMAVIFIYLAGYVIDGEEEYLPLLGAYTGLITSQFLCLKLNLFLSPSLWLNRLNILLWILFILILTHFAKRFPRLIRVLPIDPMSMTVVFPHQSVLVPHDN
jgi:type IV secretory pathway TrbD component